MGEEAKRAIEQTEEEARKAARRGMSPQPEGDKVQGSQTADGQAHQQTARASFQPGFGVPQGSTIPDASV